MLWCLCIRKKRAQYKCWSVCGSLFLKSFYENAYLLVTGKVIIFSQAVGRPLAAISAQMS